MIIKFKLDDYYETCDEYEEIFENADSVEVVDEDGNCLIVNEKRIVIPQLHLSFREADWYCSDDEETSDEDDEYEIQGSVYVAYPEDEKDPNKYLSFVTAELSYFVDTLCEERGLDVPDVGQLDCYIDTDEFSEE